ncbi:5'-3' exonuclease (including N-terminal domain of PolI) [Shewanella psychrophila]|uniref:5'-3' exonuclease (Including N-terminal domain of PolI) n=1 Tax=Shewanella psychrophila TaxID=225848 RepID=A0A1S6HPD7_9GAMM|nr:flap endonuclease Xni [Shewanella psychrophila]AQS37385.1 5'-3' exonuclease (including N-terminal domain of PolI) [Shewanella psychrophila]
MNTFLIIDGLNLVRRIHAAQPNESDINGLDIRVASACKKLLKHHQPSHVAMVWDGNEISWRKHLFEDYKKGRKPMPKALSEYLPELKLHLAKIHVNSLDADSEADDVIATLASKLAASGGEAIIVSTDKGFTQLKHPKIKRWDHFNQSYLSVEDREQKLGVQHSQFIDYLALAGDSGNKIPGVPGIGPKSAVELLKIFRSLANIYSSIDEVGAKQAKKLEEGKQMARLSYKLVQLQIDMPLKANLSQFRLPH